MSLFRTVAFGALQAVRRVPAVHRPVHAMAEALERIPLGARLIRGVLEPPTQVVRSYREWVDRYDTLSHAEQRTVAAHVARMARPPLISVVMPAYATPPKVLAEAVTSVRRQLYPHWELCIADDATPGEALWTQLQRFARLDPRIKVVRREVNGHIPAATNSALALATGEFVALMDHDDTLAPQALYEVAALLERHPDADLIYSDEDKIDARGRRFEPYFKPDFDPELLLGQNLVSHLGVYRRALLEEAGGLREGFEGSQDYDLALRVWALTTRERVHHIPAVLYHWRQQAGAATFSERYLERCAQSARLAVAEHLGRTQQAGLVDNMAGMPGWLRVRRPVPTPAPLVSVIVPTRDRADLLAVCADGVLENTDYAPLELLIVDNGSEEPATHELFARLSGDPRVRILPAPGPFNFSALNNRAAREAKGEILLLLNNDIGVREPGWLAELVSHAVRPNVGAVGAKLLYPDGRVQHGGVALGTGGGQLPVAGHVGLGFENRDPGYFGNLALARSVSAVTAACLALRREVFFEAGGLEEEALKVAFNDVDLCLKIRKLGYDIVWTPFALLDHYESATRGSDEDPVRAARFRSEILAMRDRWGDVLDRDPFWSPNLDPNEPGFRPAAPPRRSPPWRALTSA